MEPTAETETLNSEPAVPEDSPENWSNASASGQNNSELAGENLILNPPVAGSVTTEAGGDDDDDDDDEDNWSRQVETDEIHRISSSVLDMDEEMTPMNRSTLSSPGATIGSPTLQDPTCDDRSPNLEPKRDEPTLKEKLVERERQRRVETKRARWKHQFALNGGDAIDEDVSEEEDIDYDGLMSRENGSVAGTVGEGSTVAQITPDLDATEEEKLPYPMKRFLQEQGTATLDSSAPATRIRDDSQNQGVLMERFLQETPVVVVNPTTTDNAGRASQVDRSVSFDMEPHPLDATIVASVVATGDPPSVRVATSVEESVQTDSEAFQDYPTTITDINASNISVTGNASVANASITCLPPEEDEEIVDLSEVVRPDNSVRTGSDILQAESMEGNALAQESSSIDIDSSTRVLRLTAEEIEEMAAIEEASIGNAPPSERDDLSASSSFVGELVTEMGGGVGMDPGGTTLSQGTPTTAMESASLASGAQSVPRMSDHADDERQSIDGPDEASQSSQVDESSAGGDASVTANPPSVTASPTSPIPDDILPVEHQDDHHRSSATDDDGDVAVNLMMPAIGSNAESDLEKEASAALQEGVVNRQIRPGLFTAQQLKNMMSNEAGTASPIRRSLSAPDKAQFDLDGFDYDKNAHPSPSSNYSPSFRDLPGNNAWSPGSKISMSPFSPRVYPLPTLVPSLAPSSTFGETGMKSKGGIVQRGPQGIADALHQGETDGERTPLIPNIPKEVLAETEGTRAQDTVSWEQHIDGNRIQPDSYSAESIVSRAFPSRIIVLCATLLFELPVLLIVLGGSDRLCQLVGRTSYQFLMGFLPLCCAISGNVSLQAGVLASRYVGQGHIQNGDIARWLLKEVSTAGLLGIAIGPMLGVCAFVVSKQASFGLAVGIAQSLCIFTAGIVGTLGPIACRRVFQKDAHQWDGPMVTSLQDVIGAFVVVVVTYNILEAFGPMEVSPGDICAT